MASLPSYVAAARPVPLENRAAWFKNTAPTYAGIMLWFVFWQSLVSAGGTPGGVLAAGLPIALLSLVLAALICHALFYMVPGLLGMKSGLPKITELNLAYSRDGFHWDRPDRRAFIAASRADTWDRGYVQPSRCSRWARVTDA